MRGLRVDVSVFSARIFQHSSRVASQSRIAVTMPHIRHHTSEVPGVEESFERKITIPLLDHFFSELSCRFDTHIQWAASIAHLLPISLNATSSYTDIEDVGRQYCDDLPNFNVIDEESSRWKAKWICVMPEERPGMLSKALRNCNVGSFHITLY